MPPRKGHEHLVTVTKDEGGKEEGAKIDGEHGEHGEEEGTAGGNSGGMRLFPSPQTTANPSAGKGPSRTPRNRDRDIRPCETSKDRPVPNVFPHVLHSPLQDPM